jgi:predicted secreted protein
MVNQGVDVVLSIDGLPVGGQQGAVLNRSMSPINITNKIQATWEQSIAGVKTWNIKCSGIYVKNSKSLLSIEEAFLNNNEITVNITIGDSSYRGQCLITNFPVNSVYNSQFKYNIDLLGIGALQ